MCTRLEMFQVLEYSSNSTQLELRFIVLEYPRNLFKYAHFYCLWAL